MAKDELEYTLPQIHGIMASEGHHVSLQDVSNWAEADRFAYTRRGKGGIRFVKQTEVDRLVAELNEKAALEAEARASRPDERGAEGSDPGRFPGPNSRLTPGAIQMKAMGEAQDRQDKLQADALRATRCQRWARYRCEREQRPSCVSPLKDSLPSARGAGKDGNGNGAVTVAKAATKSTSSKPIPSWPAGPAEILKGTGKLNERIPRLGRALKLAVDRDSWPDVVKPAWTAFAKAIAAREVQYFGPERFWLEYDLKWRGKGRPSTGGEDPGSPPPGPPTRSAWPRRTRTWTPNGPRRRRNARWPTPKPRRERL